MQEAHAAAPATACDTATRTGKGDAAPSSSQTTADGARDADAAPLDGCDRVNMRGTCDAAPASSHTAADTRDADDAPAIGCDTATRRGTGDAAPSSSQTTADGARAPHADAARDADAASLDSRGTATCESSQSSEAKRRAIQVQLRPLVRCKHALPTILSSPTGRIARIKPTALFKAFPKVSKGLLLVC